MFLWITGFPSYLQNKNDVTQAYKILVFRGEIHFPNAKRKYSDKRSNIGTAILDLTPNPYIPLHVSGIFSLLDMLEKRG